MRDRGVSAAYTYGIDASAACAGVMSDRESRKATVSGSITASGPPAWVQPSRSERTRSGAVSASSWAIRPPIETPKTCAEPTPAASRTAAASAAIVSIAHGPVGTSERPTPRLSRVSTR